jgi:hypothetical protein
MTIAINSFGPQRIYGNYIHNLWSNNPDPATRHFDGISIHGIGGQVIENNAITLPDPDGGTSCVFVANRGGGNIDNVLIKNNLMTGRCSYTVTLEDAEGHTVTGVTIRDCYMQFGDFGYLNASVAQQPTLINNTQWNPRPPANQPNPAAVQTWLAAT